MSAIPLVAKTSHAVQGSPPPEVFSIWTIIFKASVALGLISIERQQHPWIIRLASLLRLFILSITHLVIEIFADPVVTHRTSIPWLHLSI